MSSGGYTSGLEVGTQLQAPSTQFKLLTPSTVTTNMTSSFDDFSALCQGVGEASGKEETTLLSSSQYTKGQRSLCP